MLLPSARIVSLRHIFLRVNSSSISRTISKRSAFIEAERCLLCEDAPCASACPAGTKPDKFLKQLRFENELGACETVLDNNPLGGVCGEVCPVRRLCEGSCTRNKIDGPVKIAAVQKYLHKLGISENIPLPPVPTHKLKQKVAIVGAGPAGLTAARELLRRGADVTVYDSRPDAGGALRYALSPFRISHKMVDEEVERIVRMGVKFEFNSPVVDIEALKKQGDYDHVVVSTGLQESRLMGLESESDSCLPALQFLDLANENEGNVCSGMKTKSAVELCAGKGVIVVGGGSVAMDCAVTAMKLGATHVHVVAIEKTLDFPADKDEIALALSLGVELHGETRVTSIDLEKKLVMVETTNGASVSSGAMNCSTLITAIGQTVDSNSEAFLKLKTESGGSAASSVRYGGDVITNTGATVVEAVRDGKQIASSLLPGVDVMPRPLTSLEVEFCGIKFENPFCLSSSPVTNTAEMIAMAYDAGWAGSYFKTLNRDDKFKIYHPSPRLSAVHSRGSNQGIDVGIQNVEQISDRPLADNLADITWLRKNYEKKVTAVSIMAFSEDDWSYLAAAAEGAGAHLLELNFSCPQMARSDAGHRVGQNFDLIEKYTAAAKRACNIPVIAKMTPNITDMVPAALAAQQGGADGISAINTLKSVSHVDLDTYHASPDIAGHSAISGFSGKAGRPIGLRFVSELSKDSRLAIPISGMGGIYTWRDAAEYLVLGSSNLQVTTSVMQYGVGIVDDLMDGLRKHMDRNGVSSVADLIGKSKNTLVDPSQLDTKTEVVSFIDEKKCIGCGACVVACRHGSVEAILLNSDNTGNRSAFVNPSKCIGCKLCDFVCPVDAISFMVRNRISR